MAGETFVYDIVQRATDSTKLDPRERRTPARHNSVLANPFRATSITEDLWK